MSNSPDSLTRSTVANATVLSLFALVIALTLGIVYVSTKERIEAAQLGQQPSR